MEPQSLSPHCLAATSNPQRPCAVALCPAPVAVDQDRPPQSPDVSAPRPPPPPSRPLQRPLRRTDPKNLGEAWRSLAPWRQKHPAPSPRPAVTMPARRGRTSLRPWPRHPLPHPPPSAPVPARAPIKSVRVKVEVAGFGLIFGTSAGFCDSRFGPLAGFEARAQFAARVGPVTQQSAGTGQSPHTSGAGAARAVRGGSHAHVLVR
jgi:hypothetical protein